MYQSFRPVRFLLPLCWRVRLWATPLVWMGKYSVPLSYRLVRSSSCSISFGCRGVVCYSSRTRGVCSQILTDDLTKSSRVALATFFKSGGAANKRESDRIQSGCVSANRTYPDRWRARRLKCKYECGITLSRERGQWGNLSEESEPRSCVHRRGSDVIHRMIFWV